MQNFAERAERWPELTGAATTGWLTLPTCAIADLPDFDDEFVRSLTRAQPLYTRAFLALVADKAGEEA